MSGIALTPVVYNLITPSSSKKTINFRCRKTTLSPPPPNAVSFSSSDSFVLDLAETLEDSIPTPQPLQKLRNSSSQSLLSTPWPSRKDEPFRFNDLSFIRSSQILPVPPPTTIPLHSEPQFPCHVTIVDGHVVESLSEFSDLPDGVYVGTLSGLALNSGVVAERVSELVCGLNGGDLFWSINGMGAPDLTIVYVPEGCRLQSAIHLVYFSLLGSGEEGLNGLRLSNPRVLVVVEKGGEVDIIEEFSGEGNGNGNVNGCYWTNAAFEVVIGEGGKVRHSYIQTQSSTAAHIKWTSVRQVIHPIPSSFYFHFHAFVVCVWLRFQ